MTDHKFTDDEIIKALELCSKLDLSFEECDKCPYKGECGTKDGNMPADALALINRQKREIERLNTVHADMTESLRLAAEANKDMSVELDAMRGAANSYKMHYEETERKYKTAVAEREANVEGFIETLKTIKAEAIKEFAKKIKTDAERICDDNYIEGALIKYVDTLVEEMTEESK